MDGFEFESFCKRMLERLGYGQVENVVDVSDEGRDLIVHGLRGMTVVECKHNPGSSIGRPVVQKLHSAVVASRGTNGLIITTGDFTKSAIDYAEKVSNSGVTIKLVDKSLLADMASRANIELVFQNEQLIVSTYDVSEQEHLERAMAKYLDEVYESSPDLPSTIVEILDREIDLVPAYKINYDVDAVFRTSVGVVHHESLHGGSFYLDGLNGGTIRKEFDDFYAGKAAKRFSSNTLRGWNPNLVPFRLDSRRANDLARGEIVRRHTRSVSYAGGNNRMYTKVCEPGKKDIRVTSLQQVYFPVNKSHLSALKTTHEVVYLEHPSGKIKTLNATLTTCKVCGGEVTKGKPYLCNSCGAPSHSRKFFSSHGFKCKKCGKTLCKDCTSFVRLRVLKAPLCSSCTPP
jgi:restriction system protein